MYCPFFSLPRLLLLSCALICAPVCSSPVAANDKANQEACAAKLKTINRQDAAFKRLNKAYRQSLRFGGTVHSIVPHWHATHQDLEGAKSKLTVEDIPYIVKGLAQVEAPDARQRVAIGVLGLFSVQALPCIEVAMKDPGIKGRFTLQQIKTQIEVNRTSTTSEK